MKDKPLGEIRKALGESCSYGQIRLVQAHRKYLAEGALMKNCTPSSNFGSGSKNGPEKLRGGYGQE
jgi:hypothetical protein